MADEQKKGWKKPEDVKEDKAEDKKEAPAKASKADRIKRLYDKKKD